MRMVASAGLETEAAAASRAWLTLAATSISVLLVFINSSGLTVALSTLTRDLGASSVQSTWILLSYMLVTTSLILVFGRLADMLGRRRLYVAGIAVFTLGTLLCGLAQTPEILISLRVVQGIGAAAVVTNTTAILTDVFPPRLLSTGLGLNATIAAVGQVLGPVIGGAVGEFFGWRWIFLICVPFCIAGLLWSMHLIPRQAPPAQRGKFDYLGSILATAALGMLVTSLTLAPETGWGSAWVVAGLGAAMLFLVLFVLLQLRLRWPLLDLQLLRDRNISALYAASLLAHTSSYAVVLLASFFLQSVLGYSAFHAGLWVIPAPAGTMVAAVAAGYLVRTVHPKWLMFLGMLLTSAGAALFAATASPNTPLALMVLSLALVGAGIGFFMTPNTSALMLRIPFQRRGIANALRSALQNTGFLLSTSLALAIATAGLADAQRRAAYAGTLHAAGDSLDTFVGGVQMALWVLAGIGTAGALASLTVSRKTPGFRPAATAPAVTTKNSVLREALK